jgi:hypothetical protein
MKKLICILASAALLGACEQKTEVVAPADSPVPESKPKKSVDPNSFSRAMAPPVSGETKTETTTTTTDPNTFSKAQTKTETTTTTTSSPTP